jgi:hypothetical protein
MLALKGDLGALRSNPTKRPITVTVLDLPAEVLSLIVVALYYRNARHGRVYLILAISRTCRAFRQAALPLLFEHCSCVIREQHTQERPLHTSLNNLVTSPTLLPYVRVLSVRDPLGDDHGQGGRPVAASERVTSLHPTESASSLEAYRLDLQVIKNAWNLMTGVRQIR